ALHYIMAGKNKPENMDFSVLGFAALKWFCQFGPVDGLKMAMEHQIKFQELQKQRHEQKELQRQERQQQRQRQPQQQQQQQQQQQRDQNDSDSEDGDDSDVTTYANRYSVARRTIPDSTLLSLAVKHQQYDVVTWLFSRVNSYSMSNAYKIACENGDVEMLKLFSKHMPSSWGYDSDSVVAAAIKSNDVETIRHVLNRRREMNDVKGVKGKIMWPKVRTLPGPNTSGSSTSNTGMLPTVSSMVFMTEDQLVRPPPYTRPAGNRNQYQVSPPRSVGGSSSGTTISSSSPPNENRVQYDISCQFPDRPMNTEIFEVLEECGFSLNNHTYMISEAIRRDQADLVLHFIAKMREQVNTQTRYPLVLRQPGDEDFKLEKLGSPPHPLIVDWPKSFGAKVIRALFQLNWMYMYDSKELEGRLRVGLKNACFRGDFEKVEALLDTNLIVLTGNDLEEVLRLYQMYDKIPTMFFRHCAIGKDVADWVIVSSAKYPFDCFLKVYTKGGFATRKWDVRQSFQNAINSHRWENVQFIRENYLPPDDVNEIPATRTFSSSFLDAAEKGFFDIAECIFNTSGHHPPTRFHDIMSCILARPMIEGTIQSPNRASSYNVDSTGFSYFESYSSSMSMSKSEKAFRLNSTDLCSTLPPIVEPLVVPFLIQLCSPVSLADVTSILQQIMRWSHNDMNEGNVTKAWRRADILEQFWPLARNGWKRRALREISLMGYLKLVKKFVEFDGRFLLVEDAEEVENTLRVVEEKGFFDVVDFLVEERIRLKREVALEGLGALVVKS
ncbi:hypothetical protein HDU76_003064, partial [Blyttiomyces sp. JEL0837]